jgi:hypothetical protein
VAIQAISIQGVADDVSGSERRHVMVNQVFRYPRSFGFNRVDQITFVDANIVL